MQEKETLCSLSAQKGISDSHSVYNLSDHPAGETGDPRRTERTGP